MPRKQVKGCVMEGWTRYVMGSWICYRLDSNMEANLDSLLRIPTSLDKTRPQVSVQLPGAIACYQEIIAEHLFYLLSSFLFNFCLISLDDASTEASSSS